jgi:cytochrome o ubiquinol oxidase subunit II
MIAPRRSLRRFLTLAPVAALALGGCNTVLLNPAGDVARQEGHLILWATGLMLIIVLPVMAMCVIFAWKYRASNPTAEADYDPDWDHSTSLELVIWAMPLLIIIALGALTWTATHTLDPYRPLDRVKRDQPIKAGVRPLEIQVVSLDWKWLFIYPEQGIATVNELVVPVDRPVRFRMTSSSVMNTLWVPDMAGMIYTMAGMETVLHGVLNREGRFAGRSGHYSGAGFSDMDFWTYSVSDQRFAQWVEGVRRQPRALTTANYLRLAKPSEDVKPVGFARVDPALFRRVVAMCVEPGTPCMGHGGHGGGHGGHGSGTTQGVAPPVNDRAPHRGEAEGALTREPEDKGSSPHMTAPSGPSDGSRNEGSPRNRDMTSLDPSSFQRPRASA